MNDLNMCNFIGRLGKDPQVKYLPSGDAVAEFSIACGWKTKDKEGAEWINITAFGKLAEIVGEYCGKGKQVFVSGRMKTEKYQKDGVDRYSTKIIADRIQLLGGKSESGGSSQPSESTQPDQSGGNFEDDIPFAQFERWTVA